MHSFISSRLDYFNSALCSLSQVDQNKLQYVQKAAAHLVTRTKKHDHVMLVITELHWLPVWSRILFKILVLTYKALCGLAPQYIQSLLTPYIPTRALWSTAKLSLKVLKSNTFSYGSIAFSRFIPRQYNILP